MASTAAHHKTGQGVLYQSVVDRHPELICRFLPDSTLTFVNEAYARAFGMSKEELLGKPFLEFIPVTEHEEILRSLRSLNAENPTQRYMHQTFLPDNTIVWQEWTDTVLLDENGQVTEIQSYGKDVTDRVNAENERDLQTRLQELILRISTTYINIPLEQFDQTIQESLRDIGEFCQADRVYVFDYNFAENHVSNTFEWCNQEIEPQIHLLQQVPLDGLQDWKDTHMKGHTLRFENITELPEDSVNRRLLEPQGIKSLLVVPVMNDITCTGFVGIDYVKEVRQFGTFEEQLLRLFAQLLVNVRNRRRDQESIAERERFLSDLISKSSSIIMVKSIEGSYQMVNDTWEDVFGLSKDEASGKTDADLFPVHISAQMSKAHQIVVQSGSTFEHEVVLNQGNQVRYFLCTCFPIKNAHGKLTGVCSIGMEITDRKLADEERMALSRAEAVSQSKTVFLRNISRDIRMPLSTIAGLAESLQGYESPNALEQVRLLRQHSRQLVSLFNNILDFSKLEEGTLRLLDSDVSLPALLNELRTVYLPMAEKKGIALEFTLADGVPTGIRSDESRLRQILNNLISNAIRYTSNGSVSVTLSAKRNQQRILNPNTKNDYELTFEIRDTGKGIAQPYLQSVFSMYKQHRGPTQQDSGTGLGLAITKSLVDMMNGRIYVESEPGKGSCFTVILPANKRSSNGN